MRGRRLERTAWRYRKSTGAPTGKHELGRERRQAVPRVPKHGTLPLPWRNDQSVRRSALALHGTALLNLVRWPMVAPSMRQSGKHNRQHPVLQTTDITLAHNVGRTNKRKNSPAIALPAHNIRPTSSSHECPVQPIISYVDRDRQSIHSRSVPAGNSPRRELMCFGLQLSTSKCASSNTTPLLGKCYG